MYSQQASGMETQGFSHDVNLPALDISLDQAPQVASGMETLQKWKIATASTFDCTIYSLELKSHQVFRDDAILEDNGDPSLARVRFCGVCIAARSKEQQSSNS